ncbi:Macrophage killing protein with similarity to conjugation protein [compost metagenome]
MSTGKTNPADDSSKARPARPQERKLTPDAVREIHEANGLVAMIQAGLDARDEKTIKNRIIAGLFVLLCTSMSLNVIQYRYKPEPQLLGETSDGRIRQLPLLSDPMYSQKEILSWSQKCVESIYRLSWVDWNTSLSNNTFCLSDKGRTNFSQSLTKVGLTKYLSPELQGNLYARSLMPVMRSYQQNAKGYYEWIVDVPYTVLIDGRERGTMDLVMTMKVRRTSLVLREDGLWVENYRISPKSAHGR